jgi:hypothetical protein
VSFIHHEKGSRWIKPRLLEENTCVTRTENIIVVTDPDIGPREKGTRDLVGTYSRLLPQATDIIQIEGTLLDED